MHLARDEIIECGSGAFVVDAYDIDAGHGIEQFRCQMRCGADRTRGIIEFPRLSLGQRDQLLDGLYRQRRMHDQYAQRPHQQRDGGKIPHRIVSGFFEQRYHRKRAAGNQQGVAVGRRFGYEQSRRQRAAVIDYHLLAQTP